MNKQKRQDAGILYGVAICVILLVIVGMSGKRHIDISEYIRLSYTGADGYASAHCDIDKDSLYKKLAGNTKNMEKLTNYKDIVDSLEACVEESDISNGDRICVVVKCDEKRAEDAGIYLSKKYYVRASDISEGERIDLFDKVDVVFAGISPEAYAVIGNKWEDSYLSELKFTADKPEKIATNDEITVTCEIDKNELARNGYQVEETSHTYKADKLSAYVQNINELDMEIVTLIDEQTYQAVADLTKDPTFRILYKATGDEKYLRMLNDETAQNIVLENKVFLKRKDNSENIFDNYMYWIYSAEIVTSDTTKKLYFAFEYSQAYKTVDGAFDVARDNISGRYSCLADYADIYNNTIGNKEQMYDVYEIK